MDFKVGDKAVYPAHGVGVIKGIETQDFDEIRQTFYVLKILDNGMTIMVPVENASAIGMRPVINEIQVEKVYDILRDRDVPTDNQTWNRRYREYMNKIQTGDPIEVGKVLRDLALLRGDKSLSFGERKMYDQAHSLLVQELSVAKDCDEKTIEAEIESVRSLVHHGRPLEATISKNTRVRLHFPTDRSVHIGDLRLALITSLWHGVRVVN